MKFTLLVLCILKTLTGLCQSGYLVGRVTENTTDKGFAGVTVLLKQADRVVSGTSTDSTGEFRINKVAVGNYSVEVKTIGYRPETVENVIISENSAKLIIPFPGPCKYVYTKGSKPGCVGGHSDNIIPIVYGLPGSALMKKAEQGKVHLGGCTVSDCEPRYYCTIHRIEL
ncbi:carboxypeptidase-like regulatory domain-containing protein [Hymenobacter sp.]|uniref:carboxypeptidase-like regulatory domain-containing protein n=1 Tax=Hymenobacter sp. TaxID=1898978 RepID=UPI0038D35A89